MKTWKEHLAWCKQRALEYVDRGDLQQAMQSMLSDIRKHPESPDGALLGTMMLLCMQDVARGDSQAVRQWVNGFN